MRIRDEALFPMEYILTRCVICNSVDPLPEDVRADAVVRMKLGVCASCCDAVKFVKDNREHLSKMLNGDDVPVREIPIPEELLREEPGADAGG